MSSIIFQPKSGEVALGTSTGAASDINGAEYVRLVNTGTDSSFARTHLLFSTPKKSL